MIRRDFGRGDGLSAVEGGISADATTGRDNDLAFRLSMHALFETNLKLRVGVTRPYSDNYNDFQIYIEHDPEIMADRLTMPRPASDDAGPTRSEPFRSERSVELTRITGRINHLPQVLDLVIRSSDGGFDRDIRLIEQRCEPLRGRELSIIYHALKAAVRLPAWDAENVTVRDADGIVRSASSRERVRMLVQPGPASQFANHGLLRLVSPPTGNVLLSERKL